jgi:hypothetical protein
MKRLIVLLCALFVVFSYGTAIAASANKVTTTLNDISPSWSRTLQCDTTACPRFELVMGGAAVLDHETGLVWEQSPDSSIYAWEGAHSRCNSLTTGGRLSWRLPTIQELASLVDPSVAYPGPTLPNGHPFSDTVQSSFYWSATTRASDTSFAWGVVLSSGDVGGSNNINPRWVWCVRGGQGVDPQ